ncbi:hypothetical protein RB195_002429 [Necator americanus]|uniref:Uncharacterized protein n=1 Tax=Necator americanus TaxID=51031 RepID=A0ABR1DLV7_NECAM
MLKGVGAKFLFLIAPNIGQDMWQCKKFEHHLEEKRYDDRDHLKNDLRAFFASKSPVFYARGIRDLVRRWQKAVDVDED